MRPLPSEAGDTGGCGQAWHPQVAEGQLLFDQHLRDAQDAPEQVPNDGSLPDCLLFSAELLTEPVMPEVCAFAPVQPLGEMERRNLRTCGRVYFFFICGSIS